MIKLVKFLVIKKFFLLSLFAALIICLHSPVHRPNIICEELWCGQTSAGSWALEEKRRPLTYTCTGIKHYCHIVWK